MSKKWQIFYLYVNHAKIGDWTQNVKVRHGFDDKWYSKVFYNENYMIKIHPKLCRHSLKPICFIDRKKSRRTGIKSMASICKSESYMSTTQSIL